MFYNIITKTGNTLINLRHVTHIEQYNNSINFYFKAHNGFGSWVFGFFGQKQLNFYYSTIKETKDEFNEIQKKIKQTN